MSEQVRNGPIPKDVVRDLERIIASLRPSYGPGEKTELLADVARRLSRMVDKNPPWGWRYIHGVDTGGLLPSPRLARAVQLLLDRRANAPAVRLPGPPARSVWVRAFVRIRAGALILSPSRPCENPACTVHFVPRVPWQKYCPRCAKERRSHANRTG